MRSAFTAIAALLLAGFFLVAGNGLQTTLIAIRGNLEGFPLWLIGGFVSAYFVGFIAGSRLTPVFVKRVGHIRTFTALASVASATALAHSLLVDSVFWLALRVITGFCLVGLQMIIESWINERATNQNRGQVLGVYRIIDLAANTVGQVMITLADPAGYVLFALISILISIALVPVALTTTAAPQPIATAQLNVPKLLRVSPLGAVGALSVGTANGAFWALGAVYVQRIGYDLTAVATFMSTVIIAGALAQWPMGLMSDRMDRRRVIILAAAGAACSAALIAILGSQSYLSLLIFGGAFGLFAMPIFGLSAAHANDFADADSFVEVAGGLFLLYGVGSIVGPLTVTVIMSLTTAAMFFVFIGCVYAALAGFGVFRMAQRAPVPAQDRPDYVPVPRTTPAVFELDPRAVGDDEQGAAAPENTPPA